MQSTELKSQNYLFKWPRLKCDCIVSENTNVQVFWEGLKNLAHLPFFIWHYLVVSNYKQMLGKEFMAYSEYMNFKEEFNILYIIIGIIA